MIKHLVNAGLTLSLKSLLRFYPSPEPQVFRGAGAMEELARHAALEGDLEAILLITSKRFDVAAIVDVFEASGVRVETFTDVPPNPSLEVVEQGADLCRATNCGAIYAYGGGSILDAAKGIAAQVGNQVPARKLIGLFKMRCKALPLFAVPSTSGSGSEVSNAAVLSDPQSHQKQFLFDHKVVPLAIALDPRATVTLPPGMTAATGMDALTHAVESYVSRVSDERSERLAVSAVSAIFASLPEAYRAGGDLAARQRMAVAAYEAGVAFTRSGLGFVHAISHQLTAFYGIPHGVANAVLLSHVLAASKSKAAPALAKLARSVGIADEGRGDHHLADRFIGEVRDLSAELDLPRAFPEMDPGDFTTIAENAIKEATWNFPVPTMLSPRQCREILGAVRDGLPEENLQVPEPERGTPSEGEGSRLHESLVG